MIRQCFLLFLLTVSPWEVVADELGYHQTLYDLKNVSTRTLAIQLDSVDDDVRFSVTLTNEETGFERRHEFEGQGSNDVTPYLLAHGYHCGTSVILLTIYYPWRHDLPQYVRVLETFAFRESDFEFIDVAFGPLTDIAVMDSLDPESDNLNMQPPTLVECLPAGSDLPFRFVDNPMGR
jgi:hypothetical protein